MNVPRVVGRVWVSFLISLPTNSYLYVVWIVNRKQDIAPHSTQCQLRKCALACNISNANWHYRMSLRVNVQMIYINCKVQTSIRERARDREKQFNGIDVKSKMNMNFQFVRLFSPFTVAKSERKIDKTSNDLVIGIATNEKNSYNYSTSNWTAYNRTRFGLLCHR